MASSARRMRSMVRHRSRSQARRRSCAEPRDTRPVCTRGVSTPVEVANGIAHLLYVVIAQREIHGKQQEPLEKRVGKRQRLAEAELLPLVNGLAAPLNECA